MKYPDDMDSPCIPICDAINSIPGLITYGSCSGHGKDPFRIWFTVSKLRNLYVLVRNVDFRYVGLDGWSCTVQDTDLPSMPVVFLLSSGLSTGRSAYHQSRIIADGIIDFLDNKKFMKMWRIR